MSRLDTAKVVALIAPAVDTTLARQLLDEFINCERRFVLGDWEPAMLDGGQFAEIAARIVYHVDSGNLNRRKSVDACLRYIEDPTNNNAHGFPHRRSALHLCRVFRTLYKFRSQRGAIHIDPDYSANELDSSLVISLVRWITAEILRIFWTGDTATIAKAIQEIVRYEVPAILTFDDKRLVLRTDCTTEEEALLLLHNAGERGLTRSEIGDGIPRSASAVSTALSRLKSAKKREVVLRSDSRYVLTPNGSKRVKESLGPELTIQ